MAKERTLGTKKPGVFDLVHAVDVPGRVEPGARAADRGLRLAHHEREAVDPQDQVVAALLGARVIRHLGGDHQRVGTRALEVEQADRDEVVGAHEADRLLAAQPLGQAAVGLDQAVVRHGEDGGPQARQDLVDTLGVRRDGRVQATQRRRHLRLDQDAVGRSVERAPRHEVPAEVGPGQPLDERVLHRGLPELAHTV